MWQNIRFVTLERPRCEMKNTSCSCCFRQLRKACINHVINHLSNHGERLEASGVAEGREDSDLQLTFKRAGVQALVCALVAKHELSAWLMTVKVFPAFLTRRSLFFLFLLSWNHKYHCAHLDPPAALEKTWHQAVVSRPPGSFQFNTS